MASIFLIDGGMERIDALEVESKKLGHFQENYNEIRYPSGLSKYSRYMEAITASGSANITVTYN